MAKRQQHKTATSLPSCASCGADVGKEAGRLPFYVDDSASTPGERARRECFCPTCFVYVRSPREPARWPPGFFMPVRCARCGLESVSVGQSACMQCGSPTVIVLPPKPGVA